MMMNAHHSINKIKMITILLIALNLTSHTSDARRPLSGVSEFDSRRPVVSQNSNINKAIGTRHSPLVEAGTTCPALCFFKDDLGNQWCWNFESPALTIGWNWEQSSSDTEFWYGMKWKPYVKPAFYLKSELDLKRFYYQYIYIFME